MVVGGGFEPPKLTQQIYSLPPLATREPHQNDNFLIVRVARTGLKVKDYSFFTSGYCKKNQ